MIKGHTKIELKDEITGEVKTVEHDNMVTNALAELAKPICQSNGIATHVQNGLGYSVAQMFFGGLMLFEEPLSSDPDDFIWPFTNPCTGFASNISYSGVNLKMGGYNSAESGWQEDGAYKHVWDFSTDSGNGTIASLGLTSLYSARIGLGSLMYDFGVSAPTGIFFTQGNSILNSDPIFSMLFIKDGWLYYVPTSTFTGTSRVYNNGGIFTIKRIRVAAGAIGLTTAYENNIAESFDIQLPSDFTSQFTSTAAADNLMSVHAKDGIISLYYGNPSLSAGATRKICHINSNDNFSIYTTTFTNTTGGIIAYQNTSVYHSVKAYYDYCIVDVNDNIYVINTNDCSDIKRVQLLNGEIFVMPTSNNCYLQGTLYIDDTSAVVNIGSASTSSNQYFCLFINLKTGYASYGNLKDVINISSHVATDEKQMIGLVYGTGSIHHYYINPFFLTTKNNLGEPVVKTATQSMKITYTLREG